MHYVFSFSTRNSALRFRDAVVSFGGKAYIVNTPSVGGSGCGLSVKCANYELCQGVLNRGYYTNLIAVYGYDGEIYKTIYNVGN